MEWLEGKNFSTLYGNQNQQYDKLDIIINSLLKTEILVEKDIRNIIKIAKVKVINYIFRIKNIDDLDNDDPIYINIRNAQTPSADLSIVLEDGLSSAQTIGPIPENEEITLKIQNKKVTKL